MRSVTPDELQRYWTELLKKLCSEEKEPYVDRRFESVRDLTRVSVNELPFREFVREQSPDLDAILKNSRAVIVGEPGSGKTVVTFEAAKRLATAASSSAVPVKVSLRGYSGDLYELLRTSVPEDILRAGNLQRVYLLDGIDEISSDFVEAFERDLNQFLLQDEHASLLLTSRQAFLASRPNLVPGNCVVLQILPFSESNIREYARSHEVDPDALFAEFDVQGLTEDAEKSVRTLLSRRTVSGCR